MSKLINKISKTRFIRGINCPRFFPLFEIYKKRLQATVSFKDDLSDLMDEENNEKIKELLADMYELESDELGEEKEIDKITPKDEQLEVMMPYYQQIELLSAQYAAHKFKAPVEFDFDTRKQKRFEATIGDYDFYSFLDGYQETEDLVRVIESKATTTAKFKKQTYKTEGIKYNFFERSPDGILMSREQLGLETDENYFKLKNKMMHRMHEVGSYIYDLTYQRYVIQKSGQIKKPVRYLLATLNSDYVFDGTYIDNEPDYLKDIENEDFIIEFIDVTDITESFMEAFERDIEIVIDRLDHMTYDLENPGPLCPRKGKHQCMFHEICYSHVPKKNSVFTYMYGHHGFKDEQGEVHRQEDLINMGMKKILDVPYHWLNRPINQIQYNVLHDKKPYQDLDRIKSILENLTYPLYHLDFESFPCPLPRFKGEKAYTQSVFQFNLHIEHQPGVIDKNKDSYYYLATDNLDHREALTQKMCELIGDKGNIIAWNDKFEKGRMKELASYFPAYQNKLDSIINRTFDLWYVFNGFHHVLYDTWGLHKKEGVNYYHEDLQGSYSIKKVLPIFVPALSYSNLEVGNGTDALVTYAKFPSMNKKEFIMKRDALIEYCKQDTWAMAAILDALRNLVQSG